MKLGAFLSAAGGYTKALDKATAIGANCLHLFSSPPRNWSHPNPTKDEVERFINSPLRKDINPIYFHATYLINLADSKEIGERSKKLLIAELIMAGTLGIKGSVIHLGSFKEQESPEPKYQILYENIRAVLDKTPPQTLFIIEGAGNRKIGRTLEELGKIIKDLNNPRVRVCLDTCHLHAASFDLTTGAKLDKFLGDFDKIVGLNNLELIHANDSKDPLGSLRDRHENIGQGTVGMSVFKGLLNHPVTRKLPFIIETPGFDNKGPDKQNLDIMKSLAR